MYVSYRTQADVLEEQLLFRRCRIGRDAAREIAERIEAGHGFWDFEERKRSQGGPGETPAGGTSVVGVLAGIQVSGEDSPRIAA